MREKFRKNDEKFVSRQQEFYKEKFLETLLKLQNNFETNSRKFKKIGKIYQISGKF